MKTVIIGAGISGIASAIRAAVRGESVLVLEATDDYGGKMRSIEMDGYRFDAGPSLFTMPELVDELFTLANKPNPFKYNQLNEVCTYFWKDGTTIVAGSDIEAFDNASVKTLGTNKGEITNYLAKSKKTYQLTERSFLHSNLHLPRTWFSGSFLKALFQIWRLPLNGTLAKYNAKKLKNKKAAQLFNRYATYNGSNPYRAPAMLSVIPHLEFSLGTYFPKNGIRSIASSLYDLAKDLGVEFKFNTAVKRIKVKGKRVEEIQTDDTSYCPDLCISAIDCHHFYKLAGQPKAKRFLRTLTDRSTSAIVFYWGVRGNHDQLGTHNILFSNDYKQEFDTLINANSLAKDSTIYIHISSKEARTDAPMGSENWFVMVNTGHSENHDWTEQVQLAKAQIIERVQTQLGINLDEAIVCEEVLTPSTIESLTGSYTGSLYGNSSNNKMSAFLRHPNQVKEFSNVYFTGGSVHPGGGIPLCLLSARIVDNLIQRQ